ncbi:MAG: hypothetical protein GDA44_06035 [Prochloron sp. SP5CPC1]|nr:hypothetical protein [Candidatus Paraprochloron terpiosi SP5CPC1]
MEQSSPTSVNPENILTHAGDIEATVKAKTLSADSSRTAKSFKGARLKTKFIGHTDYLYNWWC